MTCTILALLHSSILIQKSSGFGVKLGLRSARQDIVDVFLGSSCGVAVLRSSNSADDEVENDSEDDDDDDTELEEFRQFRRNIEFEDADPDSSLPDLVLRNDDTDEIDWNRSMDILNKRIDDVKSGKSKDPSHVLFRFMSSKSPDQLLSDFTSSANPELLEGMTGAVSSMVGGLASLPDVESIIKTTGDRVANLCFHWQMTGYMFRNAEYVMAIKDILNLNPKPGTITLLEYKIAFTKIDKNRSGFIELGDAIKLFDSVYKGETPQFEAKAFLNFFDKDKDGKISWDEFKEALFDSSKSLSPAAARVLCESETEDEDDVVEDVELQVSGEIVYEMDDGSSDIVVDAHAYTEMLRGELDSLKKALLQGQQDTNDKIAPSENTQGLVEYIHSRQGDFSVLTDGISPEIVQTMRLLVDFVLEVGLPAEVREAKKEEIQVLLPAAALQHLAMWQMVLGYRLRESEATGDYLKLLG